MFQPFQGPSRFTFKDPDTGRQFDEPSKAALIQRINQYRSANNLEPLDHLSFVLENYWCGLPENRGKCVPVPALQRGVMGFLKGGIAVLKNLMYKQFAHQNVADERSRQCAKCPFNIFPDRGPFVKWSNEIALHSTDGRRSEKHDELGECAVCSCPLRAKVFIDEAVSLEKEWIPKLESVQCWQLKLPRENG